jgi:hypothetical protein
LCERFIQTTVVSADPQRAMLSSAGSLVWELDDKGRPITRTVAALREFLTNVEGWLDASFFPHVLKKVFDLTLQIYVESFFGNTMTKGVRDVAVVAENLSQDHLNLVILFNGAIFQKHETESGVLSVTTIKTRLLILQSLARLVNPSIQPSDLKEDVIRVLTDTALHSHDDNEAAILHLAGLRQAHHPGKRIEKPIEWLQMISSAKEALQDHKDGLPVNGNTRPVDNIKLPDLRNSRYIAKMRVNTKELQRRLSDTSIPSTTQTMLQMVQPPRSAQRPRRSKGGGRMECHWKTEST